VVFSLASGNIARSFEIITTNDSIGEVFVARPLDREELDHYILKVGTEKQLTWPLDKSLLTA
jgi:protocadherin-15